MRRSSRRASWSKVTAATASISSIGAVRPPPPWRLGSWRSTGSVRRAGSGHRGPPARREQWPETVRDFGPARSRPVRRADRGRPLRPRCPRWRRRRGRRGRGLLSDSDADRIVLAGHGLAMVAGAGGRRPRARCARLVLVDGGWETLAPRPASTQTSSCAASTNARGDARSRPSWRTEAFDPGTWDADQERAALATIVETHAGRVVPSARPHATEAMSARCSPTTRGRPRRGQRTDRGADRRWRRVRSRVRQLAEASAARVASGRDPIAISSFAHDGHNLMRYRPRRSLPPSCRWPAEPIAGRPMQVVCLQPAPPRPRHRYRDVHGRRDPRQRGRRARRADPIRLSEADGGFALVDPTVWRGIADHGVHDEGLVRFLEVAWSEVRPRRSSARLPVGRHVSERRDVRGQCRPRSSDSSGSRSTSADGLVLGPRLSGAARGRDL